MSSALLTPAEARARLRMGRNTLYELIKRREISVVKIGRKVLVPDYEIERFIQSRIIPAKRSFFRSHRPAPSIPARTQ